MAATKGYRLMVTMPERMSKERLALLRYLGARVTLTPGTLMREAIEKADELRRDARARSAWISSTANADVHTAAPPGRDLGRQRGRGRRLRGRRGLPAGHHRRRQVLKQRKPDVRVVAVEPANAAVLSGQKPTNHMIQGIGAGFVPPILRRDLIDEVIPISDDDAFAHARQLARVEGISAGISSGATLAAALRVARRPESAGKTIVFMVCDGGERYTNGPLVNELLGPDAD